MDIQFSRIYNGVDTNIYKPVDVARKEYFRSMAKDTFHYTGVIGSEDELYRVF